MLGRRMDTLSKFAKLFNIMYNLLTSSDMKRKQARMEDESNQHC